MNNEGLLAKRDELLAEVKALKAKNADLETQLSTANTRGDNAEKQIKHMQLTDPVEKCLGDLFSVRLRYILPEIEEHFAFTLAPDNTVKFTTKDGNPVKLPNGKEADFTPEDVRAALSQQGSFDGVLLSEVKSGGGKPPDIGRAKKQQNDETKPRTQFGLR